MGHRGRRSLVSASPRRVRLAPLVLATMASQALLVVLPPTIVAIGDDLGASVGAVGQARSLTAGVAVAASVGIAGRIDALGVARPLLGAVIGGAVIAGPGYAALGVVLAIGMGASALLILRVDDPLEAGRR